MAALERNQQIYQERTPRNTLNWNENVNSGYATFVGNGDVILICVCWLLSPVRLFATPWTVAHQAPLSVEFSRQEYWGGLPFLSPGNLPHPGIETRSPASQVDSWLSQPSGKPKNIGAGNLSLSPGELPEPVIKLGSPALQADSLPAEQPGKPVYLHSCLYLHSFFWRICKTEAMLASRKGKWVNRSKREVYFLLYSFAF